MASPAASREKGAHTHRLCQPSGCSDIHRGPACSPRDTMGAPRRRPAPTPWPQWDPPLAVGLEARAGCGAGGCSGAQGAWALRGAAGQGGPRRRAL